MSGTLTVRELIIELLEYDMDEPVYISLGYSYERPGGKSNISNVRLHDKDIDVAGVYIHPLEILGECK